MAALQSRPARALVTGLAPLAGGFDLILCDIWGVLHDGIAALASSGEALSRFREGGGRVVLVSNAPRPAGIVADQLDEIGVTRKAWDDIVTSGDLARAAIVQRGSDVVYHLGPPRDRPLFEGLDVRFGTAEEADYVLCSGLFEDETETVEDYSDMLAVMKARDLWMICANPDIVVERGDRLVVCGGALGLAYEEIGGAVYFPGKPYRPIYEAALAKAAALMGRAPALDRVLAVGDAMRTDIAGAAPLGISTLLLGRGIHAKELVWRSGRLDEASLHEWLSRQAFQPTFVAGELAWT